MTQNIGSGELINDQTEYVREVLTQFGVTDLTKHPEAPSPMKEALNIEDCPDVNNAKDTDTIQRTVARLLPLAKWTRPDIRAAVHELSKIKHNPGEKHMMAAYRLLCYLLRTQQYGSIVFSTHQSASDDVTKWRYGSIEFSHDMNQWWVQEERRYVQAPIERAEPSNIVCGKHFIIQICFLFMIGFTLCGCLCTWYPAAVQDLLRFLKS